MPCLYFFWWVFCGCVRIYLFTDRAAFDAVTITTLENFDSFADEDVNTFASTESLPGFIASETGGTVNNIGIADKTFNGGVFAGVTGETNALVYDDNGESIGTFYNFSSPITALGLNIATSTDAVVSISGPGLTSTTINTTANTPLFFGIIELAGITSIAFDVSGGPNVGFDDVAYGTATVVPLPAALPLFASVLAALGLFGWWRNRTSDVV